MKESTIFFLVFAVIVFAIVYKNMKSELFAVMGLPRHKRMLGTRKQIAKLGKLNPIIQPVIPSHTE